MAVGDKTIDPVTGEPEIELADGSKVTDWELLKDAAVVPGEVAPTLMVGNAWRWDRTDAIPDHLLPRDGQEIANADVDYPELWSVRSLSTLIASFDDVAKTITLDDFNITGRFERGSQTPGTEQGHALQNHAHIVKTNTNNSEAGPGNNNARAGWNGAVWNSSGGVGAEDIVDAQGGQPVQVDDETRPINKSYVSCVIAKPWIVAGNVTINQARNQSATKQATGNTDINGRTIWRQTFALSGSFASTTVLRTGVLDIIESHGSVWLNASRRQLGARTAGIDTGVIVNPSNELALVFNNAANSQGYQVEIFYTEV